MLQLYPRWPGVLNLFSNFELISLKSMLYSFSLEHHKRKLLVSSIITKLSYSTFEPGQEIFITYRKWKIISFIYKVDRVTVYYTFLINDNQFDYNTVNNPKTFLQCWIGAEHHSNSCTKSNPVVQISNRVHNIWFHKVWIQAYKIIVSQKSYSKFKEALTFK